MKIQYDCFGDEKEQDLYEYIYESLDGSDYEQGALEDIESSVRNCRKYLADLTTRLLEKNILNDKDVVSILYTYTVHEHTKIIRKEEKDPKEFRGFPS